MRQKAYANNTKLLIYNLLVAFIPNFNPYRQIFEKKVAYITPRVLIYFVKFYLNRRCSRKSVTDRLTDLSIYDNGL